MNVPTLKLTYQVLETERSGIFFGRIVEIPGIFAQGDSPQAVHNSLFDIVYLMLPSKRQEVERLLQKQAHERYAELLPGVTPSITLQRIEVQPLMAAA